MHGEVIECEANQRASFEMLFNNQPRGMLPNITDQIADMRVERAAYHGCMAVDCSGISLKPHRERAASENLRSD